MINFQAIQLLKYKCNCDFYCLDDVHSDKNDVFVASPRRESAYDVELQC